MLGVYTGTYIYAISQAFTALAMISFVRTKLYNQSPNVYVFLLISFVFTITHIVVWYTSVVPRMNLLSFMPYLREKSMIGTVFPLNDMDYLTHMLPLVISFLSIEPFITVVMHVMLLGRYSVSRMKKAG